MATPGRSYSDPSYGSKKMFVFDAVSMGTRSPEVVKIAGFMTAKHPIKVLNFTMSCDATGDGGTSMWVLLKNTTALGTLEFVTNPTAGTSMTTAVGTDGLATSGDIFYLYSVSSVADPAPFVTAEMEYVERFLDSDN